MDVNVGKGWGLGVSLEMHGMLWWGGGMEIGGMGNVGGMLLGRAGESWWSEGGF